jgi:alpha-aminoadipic semialdehyde synthase
LNPCDIILGVKDIPLAQILPNKTYICFSHTHKGQPHNMPFLSAMMERGNTLIDYELMTDENGKRVVAFGKYAGYAGMVNCLHGLGDRMLQMGYWTPFLVTNLEK